MNRIQGYQNSFNVDEEQISQFETEAWILVRNWNTLNHLIKRSISNSTENSTDHEYMGI